MTLSRCNRGFTLPEMLTVITITSLIMVVLFAIIMTSMRVWHRVSSQQQAFPPAHLIMSRIDRELKNAYYISVINNGAAITFRLPQQEARVLDGRAEMVNSLDVAGHLILDREITYFRSDETGDITVTGNVLWRMETRPGQDPTFQRIADNVIGMDFVAESSGQRVYAVYSSTITVLGEQGAQQFRSQFDGAIAFRNQTSTN